MRGRSLLPIACILLASGICGPTRAGDDAPQGVRAAIRRAAKALVAVEIEPQRDPRAAPGERPGGPDRFLDLAFREKRLLRWSGVAVDPKGTILIADPYYNLERIGKITVATGDGLRYPARVAALLVEYGGLLLEPTEPIEQPLPAIRFESKDLDFGERFFRVYPVYVDTTPYLQVEPSRVNITPLFAEAPLRVLFGLETPTPYAPFSGQLILDESGHPVGYLADYDMWEVPGGPSSFRGDLIQKVLKGEGRILREEYARLMESIRRRYHPSLVKVTLYPRSEKDEDDEPYPFDRRRGEEEPEPVIKLYGLVLGEGRVLVLADLERTTARMLERITVTEGGLERPAEFVGLSARYGGFLLRADLPDPRPVTLAENAGPERGRLFLSYTVRERFGGREERIDYNRFYVTYPGYRERPRREAIRRIERDSFLLDAEGTIIGVYAASKPEEALAGLGQGTYLGYDSARDGGHSYEILALSELLPEITDPTRFDPLARPVPKKEARRMVWIGAEFQQVDRNLAESLGILSQTKDGTVGALVVLVYPGSPSERMGIREGDVILSVREDGEENPTELDVRRIRGYSSSSRYGYGPSSTLRLWRPRENFLTALLTRIGAGKRVTIRYISGGQVEERTIILENSPDDYENTDRYRDEVIGLTVRNLTFEVRAVLRLSPDDPGVIVSRIEPGGKVDIGQIERYEVISRVNDRPVTTVGEFREAAEKVESGRGTLSLQVRRLGESRIVTIDLATPPPGEEPGPP